MNFCYKIENIRFDDEDDTVFGPVSTGFNEGDCLDWIALRCLADYAAGDRSQIDNWSDEEMNPCLEDEGLFDDKIVTIYDESGTREIGRLEYYAPDQFRSV